MQYLVYLRQRGYVFAFAGLSLSGNNSKSCQRILMIFLAVVGRITSNKRLNFGGNADHDADLGIFIGIFERNDCMNLAGNLRSYYEVFDG